MGTGADAGSDVMVTVGERVITIDWMVELLRRLREVSTAQGGGELLLRFFEDKLETITVPHPCAHIALRGMSHVPDAAMVVNIQHTDDGAAGHYLAIATLPDHTGTVFVGNSDGPFEVLPNGLARLPLMHLVLTRIGWGDEAPTGLYPSPSEWLVRYSLQSVADDLDDLELADCAANALHADELFRESLSLLLTVLLNAHGTTSRLESTTVDWTALFESAAFLGNLDWVDVDSAKFATARGYHPDMGAWWTARALAELELMGFPDIDDILSQLAIDRPQIAEHLRASVDSFGDRISQAVIPPEQLLRMRWRADDPEMLMRLVRKVVADASFRSGFAVIGYRRRNGQLQQVARFDSVTGDDGLDAIDLTSIETNRSADGILLIANTDGAWTVSALNRENEHGTAVIHVGSPGPAFLTPITDDELLMKLRRILTGRAQADVACSPHEWVYRRVLYGLALTLESGNLDGERPKEPSPEKPPASAVPEVAGLESPMQWLIDTALQALIRRHVGALVDAIRPGVSLFAVPDEPLPDDQVWKLLTEVMTLTRQLEWTNFRIAPLADAWKVPTNLAEWWGADGLGLQQARRIPDATESLLRCAWAIDRVPSASGAFDHLIARATQIFGTDIAVLWSFLPGYVA